jgi:hypothetical protein
VLFARFSRRCCWNAGPMNKLLIYRFTFLLAVPLLCPSCTTTDFQSWEGRNSVVEGHGGTRKVVDGMDVWTQGDPPRRFQVLGIIEDERPGGLIPMAQLKHDIVRRLARMAVTPSFSYRANRSWLATTRRVVRAPTATADTEARSAPPPPSRLPGAALRMSSSITFD